MKERTLILKVPKDSCRGCRHRQTIKVDHNYYGEESYQIICGVFGEILYQNKPCDTCLKEAKV